MSGPEHYRTAEILLTNLRDELAGHPGAPLRTEGQQARMIAEAQVHATLALAAATVADRSTVEWAPIDGRTEGYVSVPNEWTKAIS